MGVNVPFESIAVQNVTAIHNHKIDPGETVKKPPALNPMNLHFRVRQCFHLSEPNGAIRQLVGILLPHRINS